MLGLTGSRFGGFQKSAPVPPIFQSSSKIRSNPGAPKIAQSRSYLHTIGPKVGIIHILVASGLGFNNPVIQGL